MNWWYEFADRMQEQVPLSPLTWFRLGGQARYLFRPHSIDELRRFLPRAADAGCAIKILGAGANVLVDDDGFDGVVIKLDRGTFRESTAPTAGKVEVGAGIDLMRYSRDACRAGWRGLEGLAGIPASIGGAVRMNAGGRFGEFGDLVEAVTLVTREGEVRITPAEDLAFGYRSCALRDEIVVAARLRLQPDDPVRITQIYNEHFAMKQATQPIREKSAGCIFRNPSHAPAGSLIDQAGLKGTRIGGAMVSTRHANFIVTDTGARARDVIALIDLIRERVELDFGTQLETEVDIWRSQGRKTA